MSGIFKNMQRKYNRNAVRESVLGDEFREGMGNQIM